MRNRWEQIFTRSCNNISAISQRLTCHCRIVLIICQRSLESHILWQVLNTAKTICRKSPLHHSFIELSAISQWCSCSLHGFFQWYFSDLSTNAPYRYRGEICRTTTISLVVAGSQNGLSLNYLYLLAHHSLLVSQRAPSG